MAALEAQLALRNKLASASAKELADFIDQEGAEAALEVSGRSAEDLS